MSRLLQLKTLWALGPANVVRVGLYRLGLRTGLHPVLRIAADVPVGPFFAAPPPRGDLPPANHAWDDALIWYDWFKQPLDRRADGSAAPPDWFANPFAPDGDSGPRSDATRPWAHIPDFGAGGDIKGLWELSRFNWVVAYATRAAHGDAAMLARLNDWLSDWATANPPYHGANWKCGQESSIRVMHLIVAAMVLGADTTPTPGLVALIALHLQRIAPTLSYAIGQANNHGTSEAVALFIGGAFIAAQGDPRGAKWIRSGRRLMENRAAVLIEADGSFSQYSLTYHRVMIDSYALAEAVRRRWALPPFSAALHMRLAAATGWLDAMVDHATGDGPNLGANDGARLIPLTATDYRDFRPSLQLASALFRGARAVEAPGVWDDPLRWLSVAHPDTISPARISQTFDDGGYHVARAGRAVAMLRYPRFRFRPGQADALHLDLSVDGVNLLRDGGTFSYNSDDADTAYFGGTAAHNSVMFDGRDQMPRLGRFLFGAWLRAEGVEPVRVQADGSIRAAAGYTDRYGARHHRAMTLGARGLQCEDRLSGRFDRATLRWRLAPGVWTLTDDGVTNGAVTLSVTADGAPPAMMLSEQRESRYYAQATPLPVLEIRVEGPATLRTEVRF